MTRKTHHVVHDHDGGWNVRKGGSSRISGHFDRKMDAIDAGLQFSRNQHTELYIHNRNGRISDKKQSRM